ncbi:hypothetical protein HG535_0B00740 [Zygotorulaspora mrakii]|uniref:Ferric oxidoreductase domain-containing protein n=1 Tax=Zygotorulaspora mrakii TaxID=42260 RepID=A0A7H9AXR9_ZYGMR|nr:uncharacterized protein HG535_0B00740 [Zygotorulaspora mrakii]QLG71036.1 hypothetical protein HG535_0B00740 [Zygotorulaspora mrakii]
MMAVDGYKAFLERLWDWICSHMPGFDHPIVVPLGKEYIVKYSRRCFLFTTVFICILLPLWNSISPTKRVFKVTHYLKHNVFRSQKWIHRSPLYHNQSFHQFLFWTVVVSFFTFCNSYGDLLQVTKRMGRISVALMPPLLFLTSRPSPLPETLYLTLIPLHKWISRVVVLESLLHTIIYIRYMARKNTLFKLKKMANIYGIIAMALFLLIGITSLKKIRRKQFRVFYIVHYISTWLTVILLHFHARPGIPYYTLLNCTLLISQVVYRVLHTRSTIITAISISPSLTLIEFPATDLAKKPILPGGHVRISKYHKNWIKRWFLSFVPIQHPFTLASLPTDLTVRLVVRNGRFPLISNEKYYVTGVFKPRLTFMSKTELQDLVRPSRKSPLSIFGLGKNKSSSNPHRNSLSLSPLSFDVNVRRVLMCVGGSAISFALPLMRILKFNGVNVRLIWVSRDITDLKLLNHFKFNFDGMEIYISNLSGNEEEIEIDYIENYDDNEYFDENVVPSSSFRSQANDTSTLLSKYSYGNNNHLDSLNSNNYGSIRRQGSLGCIRSVGQVDPKDEVDFTHEFSVRKHRSTRSQENLNTYSTHTSAFLSDGNIFRKPSIIETPISDDQKIALTKKKSNTGKPGDVEVSDLKLKIPSGIQVCFGRPTLGDSDYAWCLERECDMTSEIDLSCRLTNQANTEVDDLAQVVVIAAGPPGLIETTRRFATDGGLHFHQEAYSL